MPMTCDVDVVKQPLNRSFAVSHLVTETVDLVSLRLRDETGAVIGDGLVAADAGYGQQSADIAAEAAELAPELVNEHGSTTADGLRSLLAAASASVSSAALMLTEMTLLDRAARQAGVPVWRLLGLPDPGRIQLMYTVPLGDPIPGSAGGPLKIKLGGEADEDILLSLVGSADPLILDVNRGWSASTWDRLRPLVQQLAPAVLEDPVADDALLERVRAALPSTAVILDEGIGTRADVDRAIGLSDGANVKVMKLGGLFPAIEALTRLRDHGATRMLGCFLEPPRAIAYAAQLNGLCNWTDLDGHFWLTDDAPAMGYHLDSARPGIPRIAY